MYKNIYVVLLCTIFFLGCKTEIKKTSINLVPLPTTISIDGNQTIDVSNGFQLSSTDASLSDFNVLLKDFGKLNEDNTTPVTIQLEIDKQMGLEAYSINIKEEGIEIKGDAFNTIAMGLTTLIQLVDNDRLPIGTIEDQPEKHYRGVMLDLSRAWFDVGTIKQVISLCSWYKINYLQMHLTDDTYFTFPSTAYPKLASDKSYSLKDLEELNEYARVRGVILVPEIDVPGHSSGFVRTMPELFGLENVERNSYTLNMGKEEVYEALATLIAEVAVAFPYSPYIHIGGDEVSTNGFEEDSFINVYMKKNELKDHEELFKHFLINVSNMVKSQGKKTILWNGFTRDSRIEIPKDVIVMYWRPEEYTPQQMIEDGYTLINTAWQPLYIVNNRKWSAETIYNWKTTDWKGYHTPPTTDLLSVKNTKQLLGAGMEIWEQKQEKTFASLKERLPAMSEVVWGVKDKSYQQHAKEVNRLNNQLEAAIFPFTIEESGLYFSTKEGPNFSENEWFDDTLKVTLNPKEKQLQLRYTMDGSTPTSNSTLYKENIILHESSPLMVQAFRGNKPIGLPIIKNYRLVPVHFKIDGLLTDYKIRSWDRHKFSDSLQVTLSSPRNHNIHYVVDGSELSKQSPIYTAPFSMTESGILRAKMFTNDGKAIGEEIWDEYEQLIESPSLTNGKSISTSNEVEAGRPELAIDGKISLWDHWGAHTNGNNWFLVDLEEAQEISKFKVVTFWDGKRYYTYTIETSMNGEDWTLAVDRSNNREISTPDGSIDIIDPITTRYLKLNLIKNSANPGLHLVEFGAYKK